MKLTPARPVTIYARQHGQVWFPQLHHHTDGTLFIYFEKGYDRNFAPFGRLRSADNGRTWTEVEENVPRCSWPYSFADGELFEMDWYGVVDPKDPDTAFHYGAWSFPGAPQRETKLDQVRVHSTHTVNFPSRVMGVSYPTHPWWDLINHVHGKSEVTGEELQYNMVIFFRMLEHDGALLALAAGTSREYLVAGKSPASATSSMFCFESRDRGRSWTERSVVAAGRPDLPEGFSEGTMVKLNDGRLYCAIRTGGPFYHVWSSDGGRTWTQPEMLRLSDTGEKIGTCWPCLRACADGTLVMVWGRHGKNLAFDPSGTGKQWQGRLDLHAWELDTQALMGVPPDRRLRGDTLQAHRHMDSGDMLSIVEVEPHTFLVCYDVQTYYETWNSPKYDAAIRMVRVRLE